MGRQTGLLAVMSNDHGSETPRTKIATAQANLALALRFNSEVVTGRIRRTVYEREVAIYTGGAGVVLPREFGASAEDLRNGAFNLVIMALGASALTTDETLDEVFGKPSIDSSQDRRGLRVLVNQLRNAFAHNPWRPKWTIWPKYRAIHTVKLGEYFSFKFDATALDGEGVKPEDVGGLETWIKVLKHCESIVPE